MRLVKSRCGCYIGNILCGALSYADDVIILAPTMSSVYSMLPICEKFANDYDVIFNASKSKLLIFHLMVSINMKISLCTLWVVQLNMFLNTVI